jgi:hypothetical protein
LVNARFLTNEYDPLYEEPANDSSLLIALKNRNRAYITTAPMLQSKRVMIDRKERIDEIRDFKEMNKSMLTTFR